MLYRVYLPYLTFINKCLKEYQAILIKEGLYGVDESLFMALLLTTYKATPSSSIIKDILIIPPLLMY